MRPKFDAEFYKTILNWLSSNIYITDIETDEIVYMNNYMKQTFGLQEPEGKICWQVLQKDMTERCPFCRVEQLKQSQSDGVCVWKEKNTVTEKNYINYDRLEEWNGHVYFIQNSVDITEQLRLSTEASIDELTGVLSRNAGKKQLENLLRNMTGLDYVTVALCDVNGLKWVNDTCGHLEGDKLLSFVAKTIQMELQNSDFIFRLSGDEFILVFINQNQAQVDSWLRQLLQILDMRRVAGGFAYPVSFSYGIACVNAGDQIAVSDVLSIADTQMYIQKRDYHIKLGQKRLQEKRVQKKVPQFQYNKDYLFDALSDSIDDYVFVGNLKKGVFIYSYQMMIDFGLPGQIIDNAAAFWSEKIHPDDVMMFLQSNQEIADGRAEKHAIVYRAKNANKIWTHLMCKGKMIRDTQGEPDLFAGIIRNLDKEKSLYNNELFSDDSNMLCHQQSVKRAFYFTEKNEQEEHLKTEIRLLHFVNRNIPSGVLAVYDKPGYPMLCFNQAILDYTHYTFEELMTITGGNFGKLIHREDQNIVNAEIIRQLQSKDLYEVRYRLVCKERAIIWVYERGRRTVTENGEKIILCFFVDISQEVEHEQELRFISDSSMDGIFKVAMQKGAPIFYANEGFYQIHGYTKEQMAEEIHNQAQVLIYEEDLPYIIDQVTQILETKERQVILEYRIKKRDHAIAWIHADICLAPQIDGSIAIMGMLMDITERRNLENKLRRTEQLFLAAQKHSRLNMWEFDIQNQRIIQTEQSKEIHGFETIVENVPESMIAQGFVHPESVTAIRYLYDQVLAGKEEASAVVRVKMNGSNNDFWWEKITYTSVQYLNGQPIWAVGVSEDVTAQKEAEIKVLEEEIMQNLLTEDLLFQFRFNLTQNILENVQTYVGNIDLVGLEKVNYQTVFNRILDAIVHEDDQKRFQAYYTFERMTKYAEQGITEVPDFEFRHRANDGSIAWVILNMRLATALDNTDLILLGYAKNIDLQKKRELALQKKAEIDEISGLYNYATIKLMIQNILDGDKAAHMASAVLLLNVDGFREVNNTDSFLAGNTILHQMGNEIRKRIPASCIAGRVSGDVFLLFYHSMESEQEIYSSAEHIRQTLCQEYRTEKYRGRLTISAGIAYRFSENFTFDQLYQCALYALETVKQNGRNKLLSYREVEDIGSDAELKIMSDPESYKVVDVNVSGKIAFGINNLNTNLKCYELLYNKTEPCSFCSKRKIGADKRYVGEFFIPQLNKRMYIQERLALKDGHRVRQICLQEKPFKLGTQIEHTEFYQMLYSYWDDVEKGKEKKGVLTAVLEYARTFSHARRILFFEKEKDNSESELHLLCQSSEKTTIVDEQKGQSRYLETALKSTVLNTALIIENEDSVGYEQICDYYGAESLPLPIVLIGIYDQNHLIGCLLIEQVEGSTDIIQFLKAVGEFLRRAEHVYQLWNNYNFVQYHDQKTGLWNYERYMSTLREIDGEIYSSFGMVGIHIANLKEYNRKYSIGKGDELLQFSANLLTELFSAVFCYRISGARFIALCPDITYDNFMQRYSLLQERIAQSYPQWIACENVWVQDFIEVTKQNAQLEEKLQIAVNQKRNHYNLKADQTAKSILVELQEKIQAGNFHTFLQPKAKTETGEVCGAEALIRYYDEEKGIIPPLKFLPEIERTGLICYIDLFVLEDVCHIMQQWIADGWEPFPISLNFSRATILEPGILQKANQIVERFEIPKELIEIEITETISSIDRVSLRNIANQFVENGYRLSIDDFGTDYSNISILYSLNLNTLKLDRSIVNDIYNNNRARMVVGDIVECCKRLGISCIAEGVETKEQMETLQTMHCNEMQGYYLNKPLPADEFEKLYITGTKNAKEKGLLQNKKI